MRVAREDRGTWGAALLLAVLTLSVFWVLQDVGPESAIRRFHQALARRDAGELQSVTLQPLQAPAPQALVSRTQTLLTQGARFRVLRMDRTPNQVIAEVAYVLPNKTGTVMLWVIRNSDRTAAWRVDATATLMATREAVGLPQRGAPFH